MCNDSSFWLYKLPYFLLLVTSLYCSCCFDGEQGKKMVCKATAIGRGFPRRPLVILSLLSPNGEPVHRLTTPQSNPQEICSPNLLIIKKVYFLMKCVTRSTILIIILFHNFKQNITMKIYWTPRIYQASLTCNNLPVHTNYKRIAPRNGGTRVSQV